jgi:hypothetical protein
MWTVPVSLCASAPLSRGAASEAPLDPPEPLASPLSASVVPDAASEGVPDPELEAGPPDEAEAPDAPELDAASPSAGEADDDDDEQAPAIAAHPRPATPARVVK